MWDKQRPQTLYVSSEPEGDSFEGVHRAFDVNRHRPLLTFSAKNAGDAMALNDGKYSIEKDNMVDKHCAFRSTSIGHESEWQEHVAIVRCQPNADQGGPRDSSGTVCSTSAHSPRFGRKTHTIGAVGGNFNVVQP